jgi:hypothetical protein
MAAKVVIIAFSETNSEIWYIKADLDGTGGI